MSSINWLLYNKRKSNYKPEVNDDSPMEELEYDFMDVLGYDASEDKSTPLTDDKIGVVKETIIKRLLKDEENSENSITFAEIDKSLEGRLSDALKSNSKTPEELWSNLGPEGKVQLIDCL